MLVVGVIGAFTAIFAAIIGIAQQDIKKVLAYSTVSQLGYMFMALGVGAWSAAIFHLVAHAFFKALLFLGAGSVIHSMGGEQNMGCMGGLARRIPVTWITFMAGGLALSGIFPFAGFWSKDEILGSNFQAGVYVIWAVGIIAAFITAFYTFRMIFVTFWGKETRSDATTCARIHESPQVHDRAAHPPGRRLDARRLPGPARQLRRAPEVPGAGVRAGQRDPGDQRSRSFADARHRAHARSRWWWPSGHGPGLVHLRAPGRRPARHAWARGSGRSTRIVYNKFYIDEFYHATFVRVAVDGSRWVWQHFDEAVIDGAVNGVGMAVAARRARSPGRSRPGGCRTTCWASSSGCSSW